MFLILVLRMQYAERLKIISLFFSRAIIYFLLIYSPVTFDDLTALRVYRNSIIPYAVLFIFAGFIALFLLKDEKNIKKLIPWGVLECICLSVCFFDSGNVIYIFN